MLDMEYLFTLIFTPPTVICCWLSIKKYRPTDCPFPYSIPRASFQAKPEPYVEEETVVSGLKKKCTECAVLDSLAYCFILYEVNSGF